MNCRKARPELPDLVEQRLAPDDERRVREHLTACPDCRELIQDLSRTIAALPPDPVPEMPLAEDRFLQDIKRRIRARPEPPDYRLPATGAVHGRGGGAPGCIRADSGDAPGPKRGTKAPEVSVPAVFDDPADPLAAGAAGDAVLAAEVSGIDDVEDEVVQNSDIDDLYEDLTPPEQSRLIEDLKVALDVRKG